MTELIADEKMAGAGTTEENYLGDWQNKEAAIGGLKNMQDVMARQGDDVGSLRKQVGAQNDMIEMLKRNAAQPAATEVQGPDLEKEFQATKSEMLELDQADVEYNTDFVKLLNKQRKISDQIQHNKTLKASKKTFEDALNERDEKAAQRAFFKANPEFNTPEVQSEIQARIAGDTSGMLDSLVAFREIQRDQEMEDKIALSKENEELKKLVGLKKGAESVGKVFTDSGQPPSQTKKITRTSAERDAAMLEAVRNAA